jgi:glyoxylase I family protein
MSLDFLAIHHVAIIVSDYEMSKAFYRDILGFEILDEQYREDRNSWKLDIIKGVIQLEIFSFPDSPARPSRPESCGLRHLAFSVSDITSACVLLGEKGISVEPIRLDPYTGKKYTFFADPDGLPLELYEISALSPERYVAQAR